MIFTLFTLWGPVAVFSIPVGSQGCGQAFTIGTLARDSSAVLELSDQQSAGIPELSLHLSPAAELSCLAPFFGKLGERLSAGVSDADGCDFEAHLERPELDWLGLRRAAA